MSRDTLQTRYARQMVLPEIDEIGQKKLSLARVLCVGAGGLGCPALLYLAAAGIGHITVIDPDCVDETNLQRQVLFDTADCGRPKAQVAKERLEALNPHVRVEARIARLDASNALSLFGEHDIILDGTDNFPAKYLINDAAVKTGRPVVYGAIQGFEGQVAVFDAQKGPCYRCLYPARPATPVLNCAQAGVIGAVAGMIGVAQAMQCIALITSHPGFEPLTGRLFTLDMKTMEASRFSIPKNPACPVCSLDRKDIVLPDDVFACAAIAQIDDPDPGSQTLIDVREEYEWRNGHLSGALLWPLSRLQKDACPDLPKDAAIVIYCQKGMRSVTAAEIFARHGFENVKTLKGGYAAWLVKAGQQER